MLMGEAIHDVLLNILEEGKMIKKEQPVEDPYGKWKGKIDGVLPDGAILELKTVEKLPKEGNVPPWIVSQVQSYLMLTGAPYCMLIFLQRGTGNYVVFKILPNKVAQQLIQRKIKGAEEALHHGEDLPREYNSPDDPECTKCPYAYPCWFREIPPTDLVAKTMQEKMVLLGLLEVPPSIKEKEKP